MEDNSAMISITTKEGLIDLFMRMDNGSYDITDEELLPILCEWGKKALDEKDHHLASLIRSHAKSYNSSDSRLGRGDAFIYSQLSKYVPGLIGYSDLREKIRDVVNAGSENYDVWLECLAEYFAVAGVGKVLNFWEEIDEMHLDDDRKKKLREAFWENIVENPNLQFALNTELFDNKPLYTTLYKFAENNSYSLPRCFDKNIRKLELKLIRTINWKDNLKGSKKLSANTRFISNLSDSSVKSIDDLYKSYYPNNTTAFTIFSVISLIAIALCFFFRYLPFVKPVITSGSDTTVVVSQMNAQYTTDLISSEYESITAVSGKVKTIFTTTIYNASETSLKKFSYKVTFYDSEQNKIISKRYKITEPIAPNEAKTFTNELEYASSTGVTVSSIKVSAAKLDFEIGNSLRQILIVFAFYVFFAFIMKLANACGSNGNFEGIFVVILIALNECLYLLFATNYIVIFVSLLPITIIVALASLFGKDFPMFGAITMLISIATVVFHVLRL